ncbi:hypothetical protein SPRA44_590039 [Serratia proteamaculans]|nr:hypothetical protein SPRA44_590039 [Serratia proteamaculans]
MTTFMMAKNAQAPEQAFISEILTKEPKSRV